MGKEKRHHLPVPEMYGKLAGGGRVDLAPEGFIDRIADGNAIIVREREHADEPNVVIGVFQEEYERMVDLGSKAYFEVGKLDTDIGLINKHDVVRFIEVNAGGMPTGREYNTEVTKIVIPRDNTWINGTLELKKWYAPGTVFEGPLGREYALIERL